MQASESEEGHSQQTFFLMKTSFVFIFRRRLQDILVHMPSRCFQDVCKSSCKYVLKTSCKSVLKTCLRCLEDVLKTSYQNDVKTSSKQLQNDVKTSSKQLQDVLQRCLQDIFKTFLRHFIKLNYSCWHIFKKSLRYIQHVFGTYCEDDYL